MTQSASRQSCQFELADEAGTTALGQALAEALPRRAVVGLNGPLGAGKTRLVQALAEASGIDRRTVTSPTFVLVQEYHAARTIYHADAYRLADDDEFWQLGLDERFDEPVLVLIEWAQRIERCLPDDRLDLELAPLDGPRRRVTLTAHGARLVPVALRICERFGPAAPASSA